MMKKIKYVFLGLILSLSVNATGVQTQTVFLSSNKPIFLKLSSSQIGPEFQCYYGASVSGSAFGVLINSGVVDNSKKYEFTNTYEFTINDFKSVDGFEFASLIQCWVLSSSADGAVAQDGLITIELSQEKNGPVLFVDKFKGFTQISPFDLWKNNTRELIKRVKFKIIK